MSKLQETLLRPERARSGGRVTWFTVLGLVLVPLTVGGLLTWALWQPTQRLSRMDAAVVNLDTPVKVNGQTVPLGRQLAGGLVTSTGATSSRASSTASPSASPSASPTSSVANVSGSDASTNFTWVITDASDAAAGLADGRYATVVTIPSNFSAAATSTATDPTHPTRATIGIAMSDRARIVDTAVAQAVTSTAVRVLGQQLTTTYLQNVFVGFDTLHGSLAQAADGAGSLASGAQSLTGGAQQLATGAGQVGTGATSLATGLGTLSSGATTLASSLDQLATHSGTTLHVPDGTPPELVDDDPLDLPLEEEFRTGAIGLGWDPATAQILLEAYAYVESDDDEPDLENAPQVLRVRMPVGTARAFAQRARDVVRAGRPPCPLCGRPVDPDGHVCTPPDTP
ncbi:hypothetical protein GALL_403960 [mine drainage metagenome]|uniref:DUF3533 domain-containing protein n=1 Tax=mine drainage metagenome TaxID=410659 RepID=A0A1J5Q3L2_9ZZZZ